MLFNAFSSLSLLALAGSAVAQTFTSCNPLNTTSCPTDPALGTNFTMNFNTSHVNTDLWNQTAGTLNYATNGAQFVINQKGDAPTIQSKFYIFGGRVETVMQVASGQGIVSCVVLESDDLDEIDWEFIGGNTTFGENNYYSKGNQSTHNALWFPMETSPQGGFHNYTTVWTEDSLQWWVDGNMVRELTPADAYDGNTTYPQTPMTVRVGMWAGGASNQPGTVAWAGGPTDFTKGPFTMTVQSMYIEDFSTGSTYTYGDQSGSWSSIQVAGGPSEAYKVLNRKSFSVNDLSPGVKLGIAIGVISVVAIGVLAGLFCCIRMRRAGHRERLIADAAFEKEASDNMAMRAQLAREQAEWKKMGATVTPVNGAPDMRQSPRPSMRSRSNVFGGFI